MSKKNKNPQNRNLVLNSQSVQYSGPLPHPNDLEKYERILPGAAERIIKMAENQASHRQELEKKVINSDIGNSKKGLYFGLAIGLSGFILVGFCAYLKLQNLAGIIAVLDLGSLVAVFVYGSRQRKKEREENRNQ